MTPSRLNQVACHIRHVRWSLSELPCDRCRRPAARVWHAARTAVDLDLDRPVLLLVTVSVHRCRPCHRFFRAQPPFLRPDAVSTNRVVTTAVQSVSADGMAFGRVAARLARDFWVRPSEATIRGWCRAYAAGAELAGAAEDYRRWVVEEFSGVLCIDEVDQGRLALLLAVDPAGPAGDRLVGSQLVHGKVGQADVAAFLWHLHQLGIRPAEVVTDGSGLYPALLAAVWPAAVHQLCLFHETRVVTQAVQQVVWQVTRTARAQVPKLPAPHELRGGARELPRGAAGAAAATGAGDVWRARRRAAMMLVHRLRRRGWSLVGIAAHTGYNRSTVRRWLRAPLPPAAPAAPGGQPAPPAAPGKRATPSCSSGTARACRPFTAAATGVSLSSAASLCGGRWPPWPRWPMEPVAPWGCARGRPTAVATSRAPAPVRWPGALATGAVTSAGGGAGWPPWPTWPTGSPERQARPTCRARCRRPWGIVRTGREVVSPSRSALARAPV